MKDSLIGIWLTFSFVGEVDVKDIKLVDRAELNNLEDGHFKQSDP